MPNSLEKYAARSVTRNGMNCRRSIALLCGLSISLAMQWLAKATSARKDGELVRKNGETRGIAPGLAEGWALTTRRSLLQRRWLMFGLEQRWLWG